jgi:Fungalysin metallopeptidase (M36)/PA domain
MSLYLCRIRAWAGMSVVALGTGGGCASELAPAKQRAAADLSMTATPAEVEARAVLAVLPQSALPLARIVSRDVRGNGRLLQASVPGTAALPRGMHQEAAARLHLLRHASALGSTQGALRETVLESSHALQGGGAILQFGQRVRGVEVFHARVSVTVDHANNLVSIANSLAPARLQTSKARRFDLTPAAALTKAYGAHTGVSIGEDAASELAVRDSWHDYALSTPPSAARVLEGSAKPVMFPANDALLPAFQVELLTRASGSNVDRARAYVLAADDGRVLWQASLTANDAFNYRVWATTTGTHPPSDGPLVDYTPHPTGIPDRVQPGFALPIIVSMEGFNKNPQGAADPWLAASDTYTFGNNVRAYSDRNESVDSAGITRNDGYDPGVDLRAETTAALTFDRVYDTARAPDDSADQIKAAVTQLFYVTNWMHDYWYDSGFDEVSHNAQLSNYGRGGVEGDPLKAEAQDSAASGISDNANMSTLSDGKSPRMQMFVWSGLPNRSLATSANVTFDDGFGAASYGPQTFDLAEQKLTLVVVNDGSTAVPADGSAPGSTSDGCQSAANVKGKIAVVDRGGCLFVEKLTSLQNSGALAALVLDNAPGHAPPSPSAASTTITIPLLSISYEDGQKLKSALAAASGPVIATQFARGAEIQRDGTIDNSIVSHEWGHYLHHRLVLCGSTSCDGMSEGWADFNSLMLVIREGDTFPGKVYPLAQYASAGLATNGGYFGLRRAPYSVELSKNPFTFQHIRKDAELPTTAPLSAAGGDMNEAHNVGEIWAETLFEAYAGLLTSGQAAGRSFDVSKRRMADYVVAGMKATPVEPSFVEQRDALLSTVWTMAKSDASRQDDFTALARGFAKRGLGVGTVAPPTDSETLNEAVESYEYKGDLQYAEATLDDSLRSCDGDGILDSGESGNLTVKVQNGGWVALTQGKVTVTSSDASLSIGNAGTVTLGALEPYGAQTVTVPVISSAGVDKRGLLHLTITPSDPDSFKPSFDVPVQLLYNYDDLPLTAASDDVESDHVAWQTPTNLLPGVWARGGDATNHVWHGDDLGARSDESLVSPELDVSATAPLVISFKQRYSFELGPASEAGPTVAFDGGLLELSEDGGASWQDVAAYADPRYTQTIYANANAADGGANDPNAEPEANALAGRKAWGGESAGYPQFVQVSIDLGRKLAGKGVKLRFRIGTDDGAGAPGWDIDDLAFGTGGITNTPFASIRDDAAACAPAAAR